MSEVKGVLDNFRFETFVDVHSNIFAEYLSSVIAKLPKENPEYRSTEERIGTLQGVSKSYGSSGYGKAERFIRAGV